MKKYLVIMVISSLVGGVIGGLIVALFVAELFTSPVTAQPDKFGHIECTSLRVVDEDGETFIILSNKNPLGILTDELAGQYETANTTVRISGTGISVNSEGKCRAYFSTNEHGGHITAYGKGDGQAVMAINKYGNGAVSTYDKNGYLQK